MDEERIFAIGWLRGFFDGEGSVNLSQKNLVMSNTEESLIEHAVTRLELLGIGFRLHHQHRPPRQRITRIIVSRRSDVLRFIETVGSSSTAKRERMDTLNSRFAAKPMRPGKWAPVSLTGDDVRTMREQGLTDREIATASGCTVSTVHKRAKSVGITRPRRMGPPADVETVRHMYEVELLSVREIASRLGYQGTSVARFMKRNGIEARKACRYNK